MQQSFRLRIRALAFRPVLSRFFFEKFQQLESARQREYQGTGLGLALTKQLVELHGGSIKVTSEVGVGSVFYRQTSLYNVSLLPLTKILTKIASEPVIGRIVLVEDNEESASVICDMLTAADYQVIWIVDGSRVLDQVELLQPAASSPMSLWPALMVTKLSSLCGIMWVPWGSKLWHC